MDVEALDPHGPARFLPVVRQTGSVERAVARAGEHGAVLSRLGVGRQMVLECFHNGHRQRHQARSGFRLRGDDDPPPLGDLLSLPADVDVPAQEVDIDPAQAEHLPGPQAAETGKQHKSPIAVVYGVGQLEYFGGGRHPPLGGVLDAGAFDPARVPAGLVLGHGAIADGPEESVRLRCGIG